MTICLPYIRKKNQIKCQSLPFDMHSCRKEAKAYLGAVDGYRLGWEKQGGESTSGYATLNPVSCFLHS
jgi:hypothetical protein